MPEKNSMTLSPALGPSQSPPADHSTSLEVGARSLASPTKPPDLTKACQGLPCKR